MKLEQLTLNGATTLLSYLQHDCLKNEALGATALAGALCEMLNQLESDHPGITEAYGWEKTTPQATDDYSMAQAIARISSDRAPDFSSTHLS